MKRYLQGVCGRGHNGLEMTPWTTSKFNVIFPSKTNTMLGHWMCSISGRNCRDLTSPNTLKSSNSKTNTMNWDISMAIDLMRINLENQRYDLIMFTFIALIDGDGLYWFGCFVCLNFSPLSVLIYFYFSLIPPGLYSG